MQYQRGPVWVDESNGYWFIRATAEDGDNYRSMFIRNKPSSLELAKTLEDMAAAIRRNIWNENTVI